MNLKYVSHPSLIYSQIEIGLKLIKKRLVKLKKYLNRIKNLNRIKKSAK